MTNATKNPDNYAITPEDVVGDVCEPDREIMFDVWRKLLDPVTRKPTGYCKRERMRTLKEVFADLEKKLDVTICNKCGHEKPRKSGSYCEKHSGCGGEYEGFIDEYFSGPSEYRDSPTHVPHNWRWIACYPVTGDNEGHYVHVDFIILDNGETRHVRLALGKTFRGMEHACQMANRCAKLLGA